MKITVIGSGYVGLVSGICFAKIGHDVICVDNDQSKIDSLKNGHIPIYELGLAELLDEVSNQGKISFSSDLSNSIVESQAIFIAVGTPQDEDGSADLTYVLQVVEDLAKLISTPKVVITKSTVPAGTGKKVKALFDKINPQNQVSVASNPEFLREGFAIDDFMNPDRIVIGCEDELAQNTLQKIYEYFPSEKIIAVDIITAELIKYASNSFLATKISFINEMADLCEIVGGDIKKLSHAMGLDSRIGSKFLNPGPGFGGSCFPKDILAILNIAKQNDVSLSLIDSVITSNRARTDKMIEKIRQALGGNLTNKKIALLGLAFKANTDDIRYSPAIAIAKKLHEAGAQINAHDPQAIKNSKIELKDYNNIKYYNDPYQAITQCDAIVITTEWQEYQNLNLNQIQQLTNSKIIIDLRNLLDEIQITKSGFKYFSVGKIS